MQLLEISDHQLALLAVGLSALFIGLQLLLTTYTLICLKSASKERSALHLEMFGLVKRLEGLTASRREQMIKHYDGMLETLSAKLPPAIAAHTGQVIFETESKIINRLAELEPNLKGDEVGKQKMDELIKSMETLEHTIVALTADAVQSVMADGRRSLLEDEGLPQPH